MMCEISFYIHINCHENAFTCLWSGLLAKGAFEKRTKRSDPSSLGNVFAIVWTLMHNACEMVKLENICIYGLLSNPFSAKGPFKDLYFGVYFSIVSNTFIRKPYLGQVGAASACKRPPNAGTWAHLPPVWYTSGILLSYFWVYFWTTPWTTTGHDS